LWLTLGGGFGWLTGRLRLSGDNLTSIELITAVGRHVVCSEDSHADLFWGWHTPKPADPRGDIAAR